MFSLNCRTPRWRLPFTDLPFYSSHGGPGQSAGGTRRPRCLGDPWLLVGPPVADRVAVAPVATAWPEATAGWQAIPSARRPHPLLPELALQVSTVRSEVPFLTAVLRDGAVLDL